MIVESNFIELESLLSSIINDEDELRNLKQQFDSALPFQHLIIENLFRQDYLALISDLIQINPEYEMKTVKGLDEETWRSKGSQRLPPAVKAYFNLVNSEAFISFLTRITGIENIIVDANLKGGGLHETRRGGHFGIHRDFDFHADNMLSNSLAVLTYLNRDWKEEYGGALELWNKNECVKKVYPHFGTTIILIHSDISFHGHPNGLNCPDFISRKSLASRYYTNQFAPYVKHARRSSTFLERDKRYFDKPKFKHGIRMAIPPFFWNIMPRRLKNLV